MYKFNPIVLMMGVLFVALGANAQGTGEIIVDRTMDWQAQEVRFRLSLAVDAQGLPSSRQRAEGWVERERIRLIAQSLHDLILDSQGSFSDDAPRRSKTLWNLDAAAALAQREYALLTEDLRYLEVVYSLQIKDIMRNVSVETAQRVLPLITPNQREFDYSGIVIFVPQQLPIHRRYNIRTDLEPALAPMILDEEGELLLSLATINPMVFRQGQGGVEYTYQQDMHRWSPRKVGMNPLVLSAIAVSGGQHLTDIVLSKRDADRLRASPKALEMLYNAKVLVVMQR